MCSPVIGPHLFKLHNSLTGRESPSYLCEGWKVTGVYHTDNCSSGRGVKLSTLTLLCRQLQGSARHSHAWEKARAAFSEDGVALGVDTLPACLYFTHG